jgi:hypothetical protein
MSGDMLKDPFRIIGFRLHTNPQLNFRDDIKSSIFDIMRDNMPISVFRKHIREVNAKSDNPRFTNCLAIQVAIKDGKDTEAYSDKLSNAIYSVNEHGNHSLLSKCVFVPFDRCAAIAQDTFCSFLRMQNYVLHNIRHVDIHGLAGIDIKRHVGNDMYKGEDICKSIQEILLDDADNDGIHIFHSIKRTMKSGTIIAILTKQNQYACNTILNDFNNWFSDKFSDASTTTGSRAYQGVKLFTSTIKQRNTQHQVLPIVFAPLTQTIQINLSKLPLQ